MEWSGGHPEPAESRGQRLDFADDEETQLSSQEKRASGLSARAAAWDGLWRAAAAEGAAAALLVLLACLPCAAQPLAPTAAAFAAGLTVTLLVQCFEDESGALLSPAVTLAALVARRVGAARAALLAAAQVAGGAAGGLLLRALAPHAAPACVTRPHPTLTPLQACGVEALVTACVALASCAAWEARAAARRDSWPLRIGAVVAALSLAAGGLTGASMNPARSVGAALAAGDWAAHWVYWAGPLGGALPAAALHRALWHQPPYTTR